jgi:S1-C subfamily serine protease
MSPKGGEYLGATAGASPGSSGGVAVNRRGELIGMVSAVISHRPLLHQLGYPELALMTLLVPSNDAAPLLARGTPTAR